MGFLYFSFFHFILVNGKNRYTASLKQLNLTSISQSFNEILEFYLNIARLLFICNNYRFLSQGERLSHAVGCAFAACLERKQRRDKECGVTMTFDSKTSTFTRSGSFRQPSLTERLQDSRERAVGQYSKQRHNQKKKNHFTFC